MRRLARRTIPIRGQKVFMVFVEPFAPHIRVAIWVVEVVVHCLYDVPVGTLKEANGQLLVMAVGE